jgi:hypothetical protein
MILLLTYLLNLFDLAMTNRLVKLYGIGIEGNPLGRWMIESNLSWVVKIFAVGGLLAVMGVCIRKRPKLAPVAYVPLVAYGLLAVYHVVIFFCTKEIL